MKVLGIDIGGTRIKYGIVEQNRVIAHFDCQTPRDGYPGVLDRLAQIAEEMILEYPDIQRIGLAVPGVIDADTGIVHYSNNLGWRNAHIREDLARITGKPVRAANDAHCAALGEALHGAGRGCGRVAMFTIGTGVGGGFVRDGKLETDLYGAMAYIFGHSVIAVNGRKCNCGRSGCLETYTSATALSAGIRASDMPESSVKELFDRARNGDPPAKEIVEEFLVNFAAGVVNVANILRPQIIVIGGGVAGSADVILPRIQRALEEEVYGYAFAPVTAVRAMLGNTAGLLGAASL